MQTTVVPIDQLTNDGKVTLLEKNWASIVDTNGQRGKSSVILEIGFIRVLLNADVRSVVVQKPMNIRNEELKQ